MRERVAAVLFAFISILLLVFVANFTSQVEVDLLLCSDDRGLVFVGSLEVYVSYRDKGFLPEVHGCESRRVTMKEWGLMGNHLRTSK